MRRRLCRQDCSLKWSSNIRPNKTVQTEETALAARRFINSKLKSFRLNIIR